MLIIQDRKWPMDAGKRLNNLLKKENHGDLEIERAFVELKKMNREYSSVTNAFKKEFDDY
jgi:hypothetical protein